MRTIATLTAMLLSGTSLLAQAQTAPEAERDTDVIVVTATGRSAAISTTKSATPIIESRVTSSASSASARK